MGEYFTLAEAEAQVGKKYRSACGYADVPAGTTGTVVSLYMVRRDEYGVEVEWDRPEDREARSALIRGITRQMPGLGGGVVLHRRVQPRIDGFSKADLDLVFTGGELKGRRAMEPVTE